LLGLGAIRSLFQLMGRSVGSWNRRGLGVLVGGGGVAIVTAWLGGLEIAIAIGLVGMVVCLIVWRR
jgi:hypothetical protein